MKSAPSISRQSLMKVHSLIASFFLPMALLFAITGILLTLSVATAQNSRTVSLTVPADTPSLGDAIHLAEANLRLLGRPSPTGAAELKSDKKEWQLNWKGTASDLTIKAKGDGSADMTITQNGPLKRLELLHKNEGGVAFKVFTIAWGLSLLTLTASGTWLALQVRALRIAALVAVSLGFLCFVLLAWIG